MEKTSTPVRSHSASPRRHFTRRTHTQTLEKPIAKSLSQTKGEDRVRIIPLGGVEEVGRNMTIIEYKDDMIIIDAGLQFPEEATPGIDYIIPNTKYIQQNISRVRGLIISHGHLDHVGGIPYLIKDIGNPPIYTSRITKAMIMKRQEEFPHGPKLNIIEVMAGQKITIGN